MAASTVDIFGTARANLEVFSQQTQNQETELVTNSRGDLSVAQGLPPKAELVRMGNGYQTRIATGSAFTYVATWPTTRAELVLFNNEVAGGKSYIIDSAWMVNITTQAAANAVALLGQLVPVVATVPTDDTAQLLSSLSGKSNYGGRARKAVANTTAGQTTNLWDLLASGLNSDTASLSAGVVAELYGVYIVPPQGVFALAGLAGTAAGTAIIGVRWFETQLALG